MPIKDMVLRPNQVGRITIGSKKLSSNNKPIPTKDAFFTVRTMTRKKEGGVENFEKNTKLHEDILKSDKPTSVPIRLLFNEIDLNFVTNYELYGSTRCFCRGDGECAMQYMETPTSKKLLEAPKEVKCPCHRRDPATNPREKCKPSGILSVVIDGCDIVGGVWKLRTHGWNSVNALMSSLNFIATISGGRLAGIPLALTIRQKETSDHTGAKRVVPVVSVEYRGGVDSLQEVSLRLAESDSRHQMLIESCEARARREIEADKQNYPSEDGMTEVEVSEEYYPETQEQSGEASFDSAWDKVLMSLSDATALDVEFIEMAFEKNHEQFKTLEGLLEDISAGKTDRIQKFQTHVASAIDSKASAEQEAQEEVKEEAPEEEPEQQEEAQEVEDDVPPPVQPEDDDINPLDL